MTDSHGHVSVMLEEVLDLLRPAPGGRFADLTLGAGGHAEAILERTGPDGRLWGVDRDEVALETAGRRLERFAERFEALKHDFGGAPKVLADLGVGDLDGVLMDLGVSSMQLDDPERGFAIKADGPLDMRMSGRGKTTAAKLLDTADEAELERIFREYGEEPRARAIARKIVDLRKRTKLTRTSELAELVRSVTGSRGKIHPATRVFQALRIAVNRELEAIEAAVPGMMDRLRPGGRIAVISFHSLEDRIVKECFRRAEDEGRGVALTPKPLVPTAAESARNRRSRSARLRGWEKR
ncbi:MAG: 16S rRNA (cytosine(1402)-N(4))-methyltransferase RsmH [Planctomycetota bacterium]